MLFRVVSEVVKNLYELSLVTGFVVALVIVFLKEAFVPAPRFSTVFIRFVITFIVAAAVAACAIISLAWFAPLPFKSIRQSGDATIVTLDATPIEYVIFRSDSHTVEGIGARESLTIPADGRVTLSAAPISFTLVPRTSPSRGLEIEEHCFFHGLPGFRFKKFVKIQ